MRAGVTAGPGEARAHDVAQAATLLIASGIALVLAAPLFATLIGAAWLLAALGRQLATERALSTPNAVTLLRLALTVLLASLGPHSDGHTLAALVLSILALDGLDGLLARRLGLASDFGARFDMECDALLVLSCSLLLYAGGRLPAFILVPGLLRYLYVLACAFLPEGAPEAPRSRIGRYVFLVMVLSFAASSWPITHHEQLALLATGLVVWSFSRSFAYSLRAAQRNVP